MQRSSVKTVLSVFWKHTRPHKGLASVVLISVVFATIIESFQPYALKKLFHLLETTQITTATMELFVPIIGLYIGIKLFSWIMWRIEGFTMTRFEPAVMADIEDASFAQLLGHSSRFFADHFAGSLVTKLRRLPRSFEKLADEIAFKFIPLTIVIIGALIGLGMQRPIFAVLFLVWVVIFFYFQYRASLWAIKADAERSESDTRLGGAVADAITNTSTIKQFASYGFERNRLRTYIDSYRLLKTRSWDRHEVIYTVQALLMTVIDALLVIIAVKAWLAGTLSLASIIFLQSYLLFAFGKLWDVGKSFRNLFDVVADSTEMVDILNTPYEIKDRPGSKLLKVKEGTVAFNHVHFSFGRRTILKNFSLEIVPKEKVALVGPSGAGKSTITKLLARLYDIQKGEISIDGQDISGVTEKSLRQNIAIVPQEPILFHRTLIENIRYGKTGASDKEVMLAAKRAHCHDFISALQHGYKTYVGERGIKLSGGERQRVAIARAILKNAPILILDEATSSLDSESEMLIQDALRELMRDKTVIVIAHRLSTIMQMDRIVVMENGKITASGAHDDLLRHKGTYFKLWNIQAGGFAG